MSNFESAKSVNTRSDSGVSGGGERNLAGEGSGDGNGEFVSADRFAKVFGSGGEVKVVDVRTPAEFREAHLEGVELVPLDRFDGKEMATKFEGETIYLMCGSGKRARMAAAKMCAAGHGDVVVVEGGMGACGEVGMQVVRGKKVMSLERQVRIVAGFLVLLGAVLSILNPWWVGLSGFVGAGLMFAGITDTCGMGMVMAKMPWNR